MKKQLAKLFINGEWTIECDDSRKTNPYAVYYKYYDTGGKHKKLKVRYADMESCLHYLAQEITGHVWRMI